jgi:hypothetical protein
MKKSELLLQARSLIENGQKHFICKAISEAGGTNGFAYQIVAEVQDWIHEILLNGQYSSYEEWLEYNYPARYQGYGYDYSLARLQWIDWMIQYWQEKGE